MPKYNFTNLVMPTDLLIKDNGVELTFADKKSAADFKLILPNFNGDIKGTKIVIPNIYINSLNNNNYINELIAYYNKRGKDSKKEVTLACIAIGFLGWDLQKTIDAYLPNIDERQEFLKVALNSTYKALFSAKWGGLGTTIKKFNPTLEAYSTQKSDAKKTIISTAKLVDTTEVLRIVALENNEYEIAQSNQLPSKHKLEDDDQQEVEKHALNLSGVIVAIETGKNKKKPPTSNQDGVGAETFKLPPGSTPASLLTAMKAATQKTGEQLLTYNTEGTTFTACAVARFASGELVSTCMQLGDTGALLVDAKNTTTLLTPSHNTKSTREVERIIKAGGGNNILLQLDEHNTVIGRYLADGCNLHLLDGLPDSLHPTFTDSYIFISNTPTLYYIGSKDQKAVPICISDIEKFRQNLELIKKNTLWLKLTSVGWAISRNKTASTTTIRLGNKHLNLLIPHIKKQADTDAKALGNSRFFGNGTFKDKGGSYEPECTQVLLTPGCTLVLYSDGVTDKIKLTQIAEHLKNSIRREAYLRGSTDDITTLIATELDKLPLGIVVLFIMADGHGKLGDKISADAIQNFTANFRTELAPVKQADAKHATAAATDHKSAPAPAAANPANGAATPAYHRP